MLWCQSVKVYTDHANLIRDVLGMTSDHVYQWRLLLDEYKPKIVYIKGIHVDIGLVEKPFQHTCLYHLQDCVVNGNYLAI
jgi:hypothetical protein